MTAATVSFAGNLTDDPEVRYTEGGIARAIVRVAISGRREQEPSFFTVIVWRDQAEHASQSLSRGSRVVVVGRLQQRTWTDKDGSARQVVEVAAHQGGDIQVFYPGMTRLLENSVLSVKNKSFFVTPRSSRPMAR